MSAKTVLVVGASSGLGAAIALEHAERGDRVVAVARRLARLQMLGRLSGSPEWSCAPANLLDESAIDEVVDLCPAPDIVYLVAAINSDQLMDLVTVNLVRPMELAQRLDAPGRRMVIVSSLAATVRFPHLAPYGGSKAGLEHWARTWAENASASVAVVRPGQFASEFFGPAPTGDLPPLPRERARKLIAAAAHRPNATITLGGWRDLAAAHMARIFGGSRARWVMGP